MMAGILVGTFKLTCVGDGTVLDLPEGNLTDGRKIVTWRNYHGGSHQKWIGTPSDPQDGIVIGGSLKTANSSGTPKVLDAPNSPANSVVIWGFNGQKHQLWVAVPVQGNPDYCVIRNVKTGQCIRSSGSTNVVLEIYMGPHMWYFSTQCGFLYSVFPSSGKPVTLVAEDHKDVQQRWTYTLV